MQMRHTANELRVTLDHVLQGGEASIASGNPQNETISFLNEPEAEMGQAHGIQEVRPSAQLWEDRSMHLYSGRPIFIINFSCMSQWLILQVCGGVGFCNLCILICLHLMHFSFCPLGRPQLLVPLWKSSSTKKSLWANCRDSRLQEVHVGTADAAFWQRNVGHTLSSGPEEHFYWRRLSQTSTPAWDLEKYHW